MNELYSLVHREVGPVSTFLTKQEATEALLRVLDDEPSWRADMTVEPFTLVVADVEPR